MRFYSQRGTAEQWDQGGQERGHSVNTGGVSLPPVHEEGSWGLKAGAQQGRGSAKQVFGVGKWLATASGGRIVAKILNSRHEHQVKWEISVYMGDNSSPQSIG